MAAGFKIASAYVEVSARTDKARIKRAAERVGRDGGQNYASGFGAGAQAGMPAATDKAHKPVRDAAGRFAKSGKESGAAFAGGASTATAKGLKEQLPAATDGPIRDANGRFLSQGKKGGAGFTKGVGMGLSGFAGVFAPVLAVVGVVGGAIGGAILSASKDFEAAMNGVRAVTGATGKDFETLQAQAKELGSTTQFSATEAAQAMEFLGMAGWNTTQIMAGLPDVLDLAAAGNTDLATSADIASNIMSGFGIEATESARVADVLAKTMTSTNVDLRMLGESFKYAAPLASAAGWSFESTAAAVGFLGNAGIQGSEAGTALNSILATLSDTSSTGGRKLAEFGVAAHDSTGQVRPLTDIMDDLADKGAGVADVIGIFGLEAGPKLQALMGQGSEGVRELIADLEDADGAAKKMAETRMEGLTGQLKGAGSALEGFMIALGDMGILDGASQVVEMFSGAVRGLTSWLTENSATIQPVIAVVGVFAAAVTGVVGALVAAKVAIIAVGVVAGVVTGPIALIVAAVGLLAVGLWLAWKHSETFRSGVLGAWSKIKDGWSALWDGALKPGLDAMIQAFKDNWPAIKDLAIEAFDAVMDKVEEIRPKVEKIVGQLTEFWDAHGAKIVEGLKFSLGLIVDRVKIAFGLVASVVKGAWQMVSGIFSGAFEVIGGLFDVFAGLFTGDWQRLWDGIKSIFSGLWTAVEGIFNGAVTILGGILTALVDTIKGPFIALYDWLVGNSLVPDLVNAVVDWFMRLRDKAGELFTQVKDWIVERVTALKDNAVGLAKTIRDRVVGFLTNLRDKARDIAAAIRDWVMERVTALKNRFIAANLELRDRVLNLLTGLRDRARAIADNIRDWITSRVSALRDRVVNRFESLRDKAISAFTKAKDGIKKVWDKLKKAAKDPVNFVIETVYTQGIKKFWDSIAGKIDMDKLPPIEKLATGGRTRGGVPGKDSIPALMMADEYVVKRDSARKVGFGTLEYINRTGELPPVQGFEKGGLVGAVDGFISKGKDYFSEGFMKAVREVTGPIVDAIKTEFGSSGFKGLPTKIVQHLVGKLHGFLSPFEDTLSGGDGRKVVEVARDQVGISGRPNKFTNAPGMWVDEWCGMFVDWVFKKANAFDAISSVKGTPAVRNYTTLGSVSKSAMKPGDLALYRGDSGHINIVTDPKTGETVGGNESNSVRKQFGYVNSASSIRRPKFAEGGQVDAAAVQRAGGLANLRDVVWQDAESTPDRYRDSLTKARRALFSPPDVIPAHLRDEGGVVLDGQAGVNRKGEAELMVTRQELNRWAGAAGAAGTRIENLNLNVDMSRVRSVDDIIRLVEGLQRTSRQHGARVRVGAPR